MPTYPGGGGRKGGEGRSWRGRGVGLEMRRGAERLWLFESRRSLCCPPFWRVPEEIYLIVWNRSRGGGGGAGPGRGDGIGRFRRCESEPLVVPSLSPGHRKTLFPILLWGGDVTVCPRRHAVAVAELGRV